MDLRQRAHATFVGLLLLTAASACNPGTPDSRGSADTSVSGVATPIFSTAAVDTQHVALSVKGMYCESCESTLTAMLRRTPGVLKAEVSVERNEALVTYDSARTTPAKIVDVIGTLGYTAARKGS